MDTKRITTTESGNDVKREKVRVKRNITYDIVRDIVVLTEEEIIGIQYP